MAGARGVGRGCRRSRGKEVSLSEGLGYCCGVFSEQGRVVGGKAWLCLLCGEGCGRPARMGIGFVGDCERMACWTRTGDGRE